jgi:hypothetical protein
MALRLPPGSSRRRSAANNPPTMSSTSLRDSIRSRHNLLASADVPVEQRIYYLGVVERHS